jgi:hypothetical protein
MATKAPSRPTPASPSGADGSSGAITTERKADLVRVLRTLLIPGVLDFAQVPGRRVISRYGDFSTVIIHGATRRALSSGLVATVAFYPAVVSRNWSQSLSEPTSRFDELENASTASVSELCISKSRSKAVMRRTSLTLGERAVSLICASRL